MPVTDNAATETEAPQSSDNGGRLSEARARARQRLNRQRDTLRPFGWAVAVVVAIDALNGHPAPGSQGRGLAVTIALAAFVTTLAAAITERFTARGNRVQAAVIMVMGIAGVALEALQPQGAAELAGGAAVWMAVARLPLPAGAACGAALTVALDVADAAAGGSPSAVLATTLLCTLLALVAHFMKQARAGQDRTEMLLAQLENAREEQVRAAEIAERGRIAAELHDVLAHSLSGAAIQLQGARMLAEHEQAGQAVRSAIDRASELVKDGLINARQAVGALRGGEMPDIAQLPSLVESFRHDLHLDLTLRIEGAARWLPAEPSLALYRSAQEALTNVARHAQGSSATIVLRYRDDRISLSVENGVPQHGAGPSGSAELGKIGGGRGLAGLRERMERVGGSMSAGSTEGGWRVDVEVSG